MSIYLHLETICIHLDETEDCNTSFQAQCPTDFEMRGNKTA